MGCSSNGEAGEAGRTGATGEMEGAVLRQVVVLANERLYLEGKRECKAKGNTIG
jgi:hypothetical protein